MSRRRPPTPAHRGAGRRIGAPDPELARAVTVARKAAIAAGRVLKRHWQDGKFDIASKGHNNPVTSADLEADRIIKTLLRNEFPDYGWLSEETEDNSNRLACRRVWIVDPLDGTKEFIDHIPEFSVAIALVEDGVPILGVTYNPVRRELYWAARGMGCHLGRRRVRVSRTRTLRRATVFASRGESRRGEWQVFHGRVNVSPTGSVAYKLALVAAGAGDATFTLLPKNEWDIASGAALIAEAGGRMTDDAGRPIRFNSQKTRLSGMIASNGTLHGAIEKLIEGAR